LIFFLENLPGYAIFTTLIGAHNALCIRVINSNGSHDQKLEFLPDLVAGTKIGALSMSEPGSGSDVMSMKTNAVKPAGKQSSKFYTVVCRSLKQKFRFLAKF